MKKTIFLDRDGTINIDKDYLYKIEDFEFTYKAVEAMGKLSSLGYQLIIITNQSGIARGYYTEEDLETLHQWLISSLKAKGIEIAEIYYCPHLPNAEVEKYAVDCDCRKPNIGMFLEAMKNFNVDEKHSYAIGDKLRDLEICKHTKIRGILLDESIENPDINSEYGIVVKKSLADATEYISNICENEVY